MGALTGSLGATSGAIGKGMGGGGQMMLPNRMPGLGGLAPGQQKLPAGAGGGPPTTMSTTPGAPGGMGGGWQQMMQGVQNFLPGAMKGGLMGKMMQKLQPQIMQKLQGMQPGQLGTQGSTPLGRGPTGIMSAETAKRYAAEHPNMQADFEKANPKAAEWYKAHPGESIAAGSPEDYATREPTASVQGGPASMFQPGGKWGGPGAQPLPGLGGGFGGFAGPLTGAAALGRITQNPRLQRYFGQQAPQTGMGSPWAQPPQMGQGGGERMVNNGWGKMIPESQARAMREGGAVS